MDLRTHQRPRQPSGPAPTIEQAIKEMNKETTTDDEDNDALLDVEGRESVDNGTPCLSDSFPDSESQKVLQDTVPTPEKPLQQSLENTPLTPEKPLPQNLQNTPPMLEKPLLQGLQNTPPTLKKPLPQNLQNTPPTLEKQLQDLQNKEEEMKKTSNYQMGLIGLLLGAAYYDKKYGRQQRSPQDDQKDQSVGKDDLDADLALMRVKEQNEQN